MISWKSCRFPPIVVPWPHIVSRTGVTVVVDDRAFVRVFARRVSALVWDVWLALPGLGKVSMAYR